MAKINLLPWREELRKQKQQNFLIAMGAGVVATCVLFTLVYMHIEGLKEYQTERNTRLQNEIKQVEQKIAQIKEIETKRNKLIDKIRLIEGLQESRPKIVHVFDEFRKITPVGLYLTSLVQKGEDLIINGKAESNSRVSEYMHAIEKSEFLTDPKLMVVQGEAGAEKNKVQSNTFTMMLKQKAAEKKDEAKPNEQPQK
jgi:type IV pilus assembly protein PilN